MLGADARVVEARRDRVRLQRLAVLVLQQVRHRAVQGARRPAGDRRGVPAGLDPVAGGLVADEADVGVVEERVEDPDGVRPAAHARDDGVGQAPVRGEHLLAGLQADDAVEVAHHHRERVRAGRGAEDVVGVPDARDPVAVGLVERVLQRARAGGDGHDLGAEQAHPGDVERLALGVDLAHVDHALEAHERRRGRRGHAVLARAGLGDDPGLAHPLREQRLAQHVVDLVRAGVVEVLALEQDARPARVLGEPARVGDGRGTAGVVALQAVELGEERRVVARLLVLGGHLVDRGDERLGHVAPAPASEVPGVVGFVRGPGEALAGRARRAGRRHRGALPAGCAGVVGDATRPRDGESAPTGIRATGYQRAGFGHAGCEPAVTSWRTAARGSSAVAIDSPTSTASAPWPA